VRDKVEAAKTAGINLAFFSGNEVYWKTRWENSTEGSNTPFRTMVCYKEGTMATPGERDCGSKCDPSTEWTGLWRDGCSYPGGNACKPENALSGNISWDGNTGTLEVPSSFSSFWFWRNTPVAALTTGQVAALTPGTLGFEWDWYQTQFLTSYPLGRVTMSRTMVDGRIHNLSLYKATSSPTSSLIFSAGTVQWAWGLDAAHDRGNSPADLSMQQGTINLFADMKVQPDPMATLETGLVRATASIDVTPPTSIITAPENNDNVPANFVTTITGTASDVGGQVAGVDVSTDGGMTWAPAIGTTNWVFYWSPKTTGPVVILTRAFDDIGNLEDQGAIGAPNRITVNVVAGNPQCPCTIFVPTQGPDPSGSNAQDGHPITLGVKFKATVDGTINAIRYYRAISDNALGTETVQLYSVSPDGGVTPGTLLASGAFSGVPTAGWTEVPLTTPVAITANTIYVATYFSPTGFYTNTDNYFGSQVIHGPLVALADSVTSPNGLFKYGTPTTYPTNAFEATNYWVDVVFGSSVPLPVTLTKFAVTKQGNDALLSWSTSMEQNNKGFEVQRSTPSSGWVTIGFVASSGNGKANTNYQYLDKNLQAGTYNYRLRQIDYDGHYQYSKTVQIVFDGHALLDLKQNVPNPFNSSTTIEIVVPKSMQVQVRLYDQLGRVVESLMDEMKTPGNYTIQVNRNGLRTGVYYYQLRADGQTMVKKMTVL
jgi:uncharacterized protein DUF4082/N,N-dimethylformamidase beta subunit-like protein/type IX secretion system substrate protein